MENEVDPRRPHSMTRRQCLLGVTLGATSLAAQAMVPRRKLDLLGQRKLEDLIPKQIGQGKFLSKSGLVVPPSDQLSDSLYAQLLTRVYLAEDSLPIMLLIAQSPAQDGILQVHRPEVCYPASGYTLTASEVHQLPISPGVAIPTRIFTAFGRSRTEQLLYWTRIGSELPTSWLDQRIAVARANVKGEIPDGILVRISTIAPDRSAIAVLDQFAKLMLEAVSEAGRPVLTGAFTSDRRQQERA